MIYLSGVTSHRDEPALVAAGVGLMVQPGNSYARWADRYPCHAADNGCFGDRWEEDRWLRWLERVPVDRCLFAVAPDVYPDAAATLERSARYFDLIRALGFPVALVAQDGAERLDLPWDDFDALFVGGEARPRGEWKVSAAAEGLVRRARGAGKWVHMGRVNSLSRMERARSMGCNSADGTFLKYRRRLRAAEVTDHRDTRGAAELTAWRSWLVANQPLPGFIDMEGPSHPVHRRALR